MIIYPNPTKDNLIKDIEELYKKILAKLPLELANLYNYFKLRVTHYPFTIASLTFIFNYYLERL